MRLAPRFARGDRGDRDRLAGGRAGGGSLFALPRSDADVTRHLLGSIVVSATLGLAGGLGLSALLGSTPEAVPDVPESPPPAAAERLRNFVPPGSIRIDARSSDGGTTYALVATFSDRRRPPIDLARDLEAALIESLDEILGLETTDLGELGARITLVYREPSDANRVVFAHVNIAKEADGAEASRYTISLTVSP